MIESHWIYKNKSIIEPPLGYEGFIYLITNLTNDFRYIGRKYINSTRKKNLTANQRKQGLKRRPKVTTESNWKMYTGSNKTLNNDIINLGKDNFKFEILYWCKTKAHTNYMEMWYQFKTNCILDSKYYNDAIGSNKFSNISEKDALLEVINS